MIDKFEKVGIIIIIAIVLQLIFIPLSIYVHELTHKFDYRNIEKFNEKICVLKDCDKEQIGSYTFNADISQIEEINDIKKYTEIHAKLTMFSILLLYFLIISIIIKIIIRKEN